ncbi:type I-C CRISPR-associated protein Cas7/Csd2 [uncultured Parolsenella sp.]|uniref:type I-C CRISPR-associated protein Cas7/Csd2 n=1 Tax=uncultured Parolsenella sp. TaxID=2083008 RepID=UPI0027DB4835|nr:type I-C CRISPR-associated protein Cas7/Csd2 [uncultured Parolsenella sp.]
MTEPIKNRYDFSLFFDVENGNPNGDPDAGNMPRIDPETGIGIVSDVCLKRKVRNYVELVRGEQIDDDLTPDTQGYKIYVQEKAVLNNRNKLAYDRSGIKPEKKKLPKKIEDQRMVTKFMCDNFFDIRAFGAVMTTEINCGQVRGPIQLCFARSIDPILPQEMSITRMAVTNEKDVDKERTMGRKQFVPYGLYRVNGFISASLAEKTGFSEGDLNLFFEALMNMFENDRSAARGLMTSRGLYVFKHESKLGNAPAHALFDTVAAKRKTGTPARSFADYEITADISSIPEGVEMSKFDWISPSA